ncbi:MAG: TolC family protein [Bacteroidetes bacterium]|nr:TolC family protein [Bacteroidota bacterium]
MRQSTITILGIILAILLFADTARGQEIITLDQAISVSLENNIELKKTRNNALVAKSNKFQALMNYLPTLNAGINYDYFLGTFFDNNAARQVTATTNSSTPRIDMNAVLFNGFANTYYMKQINANEEAAQHAIDAQKVLVRSNVLANYLNVLLDRENIYISHDRIELLERQLDREIKRESVGVGNLELVYNFRSQLANEKLNGVNLNNRYKTDLLILLQVMFLDPNKDYEVEAYDISSEEILSDVESFDTVLAASLDFSPDFQRSEASNQSANYQLKYAKAARYPTINFFGRVGSNYSSNGALNPESGEFESKAGFNTQLGYNEYEYLNFSLNIPLFNRGRTNNTIQVAKINVLNSELDTKLAYQTIVNSVQRVYLDLVSAQNTYKAAQENLTALNQSYEFSSKRYETGNTDFFTYLESLNNKNRAESELVNAKYSIVFRKKILDIYKGL